MKICVYGASSNNIDPAYLQAGEALGLAMAKRGHGLVFGGGANGLMGAAARGMTAGNGEIIGVAPRFFDVDGVLYPHCTEFVYTETMRERKAIMEERADAFIMTPGGIGTLEEFYEIVTLRQLGRLSKPVAILNTKDYYRPVLDMWEQAISQGFMTQACRGLFTISDDPEKLLDQLEQASTQTTNLYAMKNIGKRENG
jgi:uncharacterized protein (TIGR00730 family)